MQKKVVISFNKVDEPYGWMGNMSNFKVSYEGKIWLTTEALFQAMRFEGSPEIQEKIRVQKSPMAAKMVAKTKEYQHLKTVVAMSERDLENMRICIGLKLEQHPALKEKLKKTANFEIYEDIGKRNGERHLFWGAKLIEGEWIGKNWMGKIWMDKRAELLKE
jgi:predicted NAD-dependent protein-ADP-ribosyltransferase YbiA (DUF1768 family)